MKISTDMENVPDKADGSRSVICRIRTLEDKRSRSVEKRTYVGNKRIGISISISIRATNRVDT